MELIVANDFQNNLDQIIIVGISSHFAGTLNEIEYLYSPHKNMDTLEKIPYNTIGKFHLLVQCLKCHNADERI